MLLSRTSLSIFGCIDTYTDVYKHIEIYFAQLLSKGSNSSLSMEKNLNCL